MLKIAEEINQWGKDKSHLVAKIDLLNEIQLVLEKEKEQKNKEDEVQIIHPVDKTNT